MQMLDAFPPRFWQQEPAAGMAIATCFAVGATTTHMHSACYSMRRTASKAIVNYSATLQDQSR
jgi:hypothetical protein